MPNKSARYYIGKVLSVLDWIKAGKSEELRECGKIDGRCAEIVRAQVEVINEVKHIISEPETLNVYFAMAMKKESPMEMVPNLFKQLDREESIGEVSSSMTISELTSMMKNLDPTHKNYALQYDSIFKAIRFMQITDRFLSKDKAHAQMIKDRLEGD